MKKKHFYYVDNKEFHEELRVWLEKRKKHPNKSLPESIVKKIQLLVEGYSYKHNFINYTYKDTMISEAIYTCIRYADRFNPEYKNPFAYFTRIAWSSFIKIINLEKRNQEMHKDVVEQYYLNHMSEHNDSTIKKAEDYHNMFSADYIKENKKDKYKLKELESPVTVTINGKTKKFSCMKKYKMFCKKMKKEQKDKNEA